MTLEASLRGIVGSAHVLQGGDLAAYEIDWRKRYHGRARLVVRPATTAEVAAVVQACAAAGAAIVPQGGNTGLVGASVPDGSGTQVLMHMGRLNRIRAKKVRYFVRSFIAIFSRSVCALHTTTSRAPPSPSAAQNLPR